ncbi:MAG: hydrogenase maturation nickel metallochaperone HypA [Bdellovibrionaceae bacterium]|jgi:hydrogenase nickel incorporation protein HypA/HybF|nr:hydrogenase maturation nickel metallochaperone HypA [Pseudobdellovibrionaceae bacterium]
MHELSIAENIVDISLEHMQAHACHKVLSVHLEVGALSGVVKECLEFVFPEACEGSALEGCELTIDTIPVGLLCASCNKESLVEEFKLTCPLCESAKVKLTQGKELLIKTMEIE